MITDLNKINTDTEEGKLLLVAIVMISCELHTDKTPNEIIKKLNSLKGKMSN